MKKFKLLAIAIVLAVAGCTSPIDSAPVDLNEFDRYNYHIQLDCVQGQQVELHVRHKGNGQKDEKTIINLTGESTMHWRSVDIYSKTGYIEVKGTIHIDVVLHVLIFKNQTLIDEVIFQPTQYLNTVDIKMGG
jgi:hypothetical protein